MTQILAPIAKVLGFLMNEIYVLLDHVLHIQNVGLTIIVFTIVIYLCLFPLTYQQQKFSKMTMIMNPEIQAVQKKYKGKRDQHSMTAMNEETQAIYKKYGVSPSGSCIYLVIQLPILFALYRVIYNVPTYITSIHNTFDNLVNGIVATPGYKTTITNFYTQIKENNSYVFRGVNLDFSTATTAHDSIISVLYKCTTANWDLLKTTFTNLGDMISTTQSTILHVNNFLGINIVYSPKTIIVSAFHDGNVGMIFLAVLLPLLSAGSQFLNIRLMPQASSANSDENPLGKQMKLMNYMMPIYSFVMVFFVPAGLGIYWIMGALIRSTQQFFINKSFEKVDMQELIKQNQKKAEIKNKKRIEKKGVVGSQIASAAKINTKKIDGAKAEVKSDSMASKASVSNTPSVSQDKSKYKEGSMASKASKVKNFNENKKN